MMGGKRALLLAGPSGGGKTTVMNELVRADGGFELVRSATTRQRRYDGNDSEYIYLSRERFSELCQSGGMLEFTEYGGNLYGTPRSEIDRIINGGKTPILILDLVGAASVRKLCTELDIYAVYVYQTPSVLARRLEERYRDAGGARSERYLTRMMNNRRDYAAALEWGSLFDIAVLSDSLDGACATVANAFRAEEKCFDSELFVKMSADPIFPEL